MQRYLKRSRSSRASNSPTVSNKRSQRRGSDVWGSQEPASICAWNCNGLTVRLANSANRKELLSFMRENQPDVMCFSEVRCAAKCDNPKAKRGDGAKRYREQLKEAAPPAVDTDATLVRDFLDEPELAEYEPYFSLADWKYAGSAMFINRKRVCRPKLLRFSLDAAAKPAVHDPNGRVIYADFGSYGLLHTYSPNNGWAESHFDRRKDWDASVKGFLKAMHQEDKRIIWTGDLNVAPTDLDMSHPSHYKRQVQKKPGGPPVAPENVGQPGCTQAERDRFADILDAAGMTDFYRSRHLEPVVDAKGKMDAEEPVFSWRGYRGKHSGRGLRIDHFVGSVELDERITRVEIMGRGTDAKGFMGSDHCPLTLQIRPGKTGEGPEEKK